MPCMVTLPIPTFILFLLDTPRQTHIRCSRVDVCTCTNVARFFKKKPTKPPDQLFLFCAFNVARTHSGCDRKAQVVEETFVSALLSSGRVTASPDELAAAYAHASGSSGGDRDAGCHHALTLEHLAAFATDGGGGCASAEYTDGGRTGYSDWVSWVGAARPGDGGAAARRALVKARVKCRDAGLLGRSFPGEVFAKLDPEGAGRVGRPAFKRALREMGFALVDEAPENNSEGLLGGDAELRALEEAGGGRRGGGGALGRMVEESSAAAANGDEEIRLRRVEGGERDEERRNAFREKVKDIERATAEKVG